jgi:hypothetical protein
MSLRARPIATIVDAAASSVGYSSSMTYGIWTGDALGPANALALTDRSGNSHVLIGINYLVCVGSGGDAFVHGPGDVVRNVPAQAGDFLNQGG